MKFANILMAAYTYACSLEILFKSFIAHVHNLQYTQYIDARLTVDAKIQGAKSNHIGLADWKCGLKHESSVNKKQQNTRR